MNGFDFSKAGVTVEYQADGGQVVQCSASGDDVVHLKRTVEGNILNITLLPSLPVRIARFRIRIPFTFQREDQIFSNGFQSWTDTREYGVNERMRGYNRLTELYMKSSMANRLGVNRAGDATFHAYPRGRGVCYGYSYGYVRRGNDVYLLGSLSERSGYTILTFDARRNTIWVEKELEGVTFDRETQLLSLTAVEGTYDEAFDRYFEQMGVPKPRVGRTCGYTTWYNYYTGINMNIIRRDLDALSAHGGFDVFQIDDGYQTAVGDWFSIRKKEFPDGMRAAADLIHSKGLKAGLWLAPFGAQRDSKLFAEHPDWFVRGQDGEPWLAGGNWGGFYALDIYRDDVRQYLQKLFDVVLNEWGFDLLKLDFLYAAAVRPIHNRTRGEVMCDAMDLVRKLTGDRMMLACGVPMMPAFGKADFCRIGADMSLSWRRKLFDGRENASTPNAIDNTVFRRHLDGRAFLNDPDVFLLRDTNIHFNLKKRCLLAKVNSLMGSLLFCSDNVSEYGEEQERALREILSGARAKIISAGYIRRDVMQIRYLRGGRPETLTFRVGNGRLFGQGETRTDQNY